MNKLLNSFLDLKCPIHGSRLKPSHISKSLFCKKERILNFHPNELCGIWNLERIEDILRLNGLYISDFHLKKLSDLKEYFIEQ
jgi:hypothetical protein